MERTLSWVEEQLLSDEGRRLYEESRLILEVTEAIAGQIEDLGITRAEVASRMEVSPPFVTQLLRGDRNMTLRSVAGLAFACGIRFEVLPIPLNEDGFVEATETVIRPTPRLPQQTEFQFIDDQERAGEQALAA